MLWRQYRGLTNCVVAEETDSILSSNNWELKIVNYSDFRVGPFGVLSLRDRMEEIRVRYTGRDFPFMKDLDRHIAEGLEIEKQIFEHTDISPEDITDESIRKYFENYT